MTMAIQEYAKRSKRAAEMDGLNDIVGGVTFVGITLMWYANQRLTATFRGPDFRHTPEFRQEMAFFLLAVVGVFAAILISRRVATVLRERFVYSRLGYVAQRAAPARRKKLVVTAAFLSASLLSMTITRTLFDTGKPLPFFNTGVTVAALATFSAALYLYHFAKLGFLRHLVLAIVSVLAGLVLAMTGLEDMTAILSYTFIVGITLIISGTVTFLQLLRTPRIDVSETAAEDAA